MRGSGCDVTDVRDMTANQRGHKSLQRNETNIRGKKTEKKEDEGEDE